MSYEDSTTTFTTTETGSTTTADTTNDTNTITKSYDNTQNLSAFLEKTIGEKPKRYPASTTFSNDEKKSEVSSYVGTYTSETNVEDDKPKRFYERFLRKVLNRFRHVLSCVKN
eukprot:UN19958